MHDISLITDRGTGRGMNICHLLELLKKYLDPVYSGVTLKQG